MNRWLFLLCLFVFTACQPPRTQAPEVTAAETEAEAERLKDDLYAQDFTHLYDAPPSRWAMERMVAKAARRIGPAAIQLCDEMRRADSNQHRETRPCVFDVELGGKKVGFNAYADGQKIVLGPQLVEYLRTEEQLAFVLAHEFAHNIMQHVESVENSALVGLLLGSVVDAALGTYGASGDVGASIGSIAYSQAYEEEADYVGMYILARAGYDTEGALGVWRMLSAVNPEGMYVNVTHPTAPSRYVLMEKTRAEITGKQERGEALMPEASGMGDEAAPPSACRRRNGRC